MTKYQFLLKKKEEGPMDGHLFDIRKIYFAKSA